MKLLQPKFTILEQAPGIDGMLKQIEIAGRTCYKSHEKITEGSAEKFVERMKSNQHLSVLEHGAIYLKVPFKIADDLKVKAYSNNPYSFVRVREDIPIDTAYITTNYRVLVENGWEDDLQYLCEPTEFHERRVTVRFNTDIGISREFNRHRVNSICEESTRYCNFSKGKFGGEISVVQPIRVRGEAIDALKDLPSIEDSGLLELYCYDISEYKYNRFANDMDVWMFANLACQWSYLRLTKEFGWSAQEARSILPLDTATELVHTAFVSDWENFFKLRCDSHAHPMARELAIPLRDEFFKRGLIENVICIKD